jgi:hypothetical protein
MTARDTATRRAGQALAHQTHTAATYGPDSQQAVQAATDANTAVATARRHGATVGQIVTAGLQHIPANHA